MKKGFIRLWFVCNPNGIQVFDDDYQQWLAIDSISEIHKVTSVAALAKHTRMPHSTLHKLDGNTTCDGNDRPCTLMQHFPVYLLSSNKFSFLVAAHYFERIFLDKILNET
jgi:hypothetical protein